ncbi:unnamed protein product, partial [Brenthis ino]
MLTGRSERDGRVSCSEPVFALSKFGKPVIVIGQYRYNKYSRAKGPKAQWIQPADRLQVAPPAVDVLQEDHDHM